MSSKLLTSWLPVSKKRTRRAQTPRLGIELLEDRTMLNAALPPDIIVGRTLSAYTVAGIQNNRLDITYTVYNETADDISGVLLTTSLESGVTFATASKLPDRSGQDLAWSLGTIHGFDRASVTLTVTLPAAPPLQIDSGARAFGTQNAGMVTDDTPPAVLSNRIIPADQLASTPDANWSDPFIQEQAAKLDYDPQRIFDYLNNEVGYESYVGSLRGARGTLWSVAGNSLDEASLGVALFRASGIPARYAHGTLSDPLAKQLILSMFPASFQTVGYIPAGTEVADPANDPQLLSETRDHYWLQVDLGSSFVNADTSGLGATTFGAVFTTVESTFVEVADALRHKVQVKLDAETYSQASAAFGLTDGLSTQTVLDQTFNSVDLVGRALTLGNFVAQDNAPGLSIGARTTTYTPYLLLGDEALLGDNLPDVITGTQFQEVTTNFPFGNQLLTGYFLNMILYSPGKPTETYDRTLLDRIGYATRSSRSAVNVTVDPNAPPALMDDDVWTVHVLPGQENPVPSSALAADLAQSRAILETVEQSEAFTPYTESVYRRSLGYLTRQIGHVFASVSDAATRQLAAAGRLAAYTDRPRLVIVSHRSEVIEGSSTESVMVDLRRDTIRVLAAPNQSVLAVAGFNSRRGIEESALEGHVVKYFTAGTSVSVVETTAEVFAAAASQAIPILSISADDAGVFQAISLTPEAKARIAIALQAGRVVLVPRSPVELAGRSTVAWYEVNPATGETIGVIENGGHGAFLDFTVTLAFVAFISGALAAKARLINASPDIRPSSLTELKAQVRAFLSSGDNFAVVGLAGVVSFGAGGIGAVAVAGVESVFLLGIYMAALANNVDPDACGLTYNPRIPTLQQPHNASGSLAPVDSFPAGSFSGQVQSIATTAAGAIQVDWNGAITSSFQLTSLATTGFVVAGSGTVIGTGVASVTASSLVAVSMTGDNSYSLSGMGCLGLYTPTQSALGVGGEWDNYTANVTGNVTITLTTDKLTLNGQPLPLGTYTITTSAATLTGSGATSSPNFAGSVSITATDGTVALGPGAGSVTVGGSALDLTNGATLVGYTGSITVAAGGGGSNLDVVTLNGTNTHVLTVSTSPSAVNADQNTSASFQANAHTSLGGNYTLSAEAPPGWTATISDSGVVTVTPAPGTQSGIYSVRVVARSDANADLVAQAIVPVTVAATAPGINFTVDPDVIFTVPYAGAVVPTAYRANIQNLGPASDSYTLVFSNLPSGFTLLNSGTSVTVPAGETGVLGVYLQPLGTLPAPGTPLSFTVTATSTSDPAITQTRIVSFTMPEVHGVILTATPGGFGALPGGSVSSSLTVSAVGNISETVDLSAVLSAGLTTLELPTTLTLAPGETQVLPLSLIVAGTVALNSTLAARVTAKFNPLGDVYDQTITIPIRVTVPGADLLANAAFAAGLSSDPSLSNRLSDLATAITSLFQNSSDPVAKAQAIAALDAIIRLSGADVFLSPFVPELTAYRSRLAGAVSATEIRAVIADLPSVIGPFAEVVAAAAAHGFTLDISPHSAILVPGQAAQVEVYLRNTGYQTTTYDFDATIPSSTVSGTFSRTSITLKPGESIPLNGNRVTLSLTESTGELTSATFTVRVTAQENSAITRTTTGALAVRPAFLQITSVAASPGFTEPGGSVQISARILNTAFQVRPVLAGYVIRDAAGQTVFTSSPVALNLSPQTSLLTANLGTLDTTGFERGTYTVLVTVTDPDGTPITGGTGTGTVLVGSPVSGDISVSPSTLPPGDSLVTTTIHVHSETTFPDPLTQLGIVATSAPATAVSLDGSLAFVARTDAISVIDVSDPTNPVILTTFGQGEITPGGYNVCQVDGTRLVVASTNTENASAFDLIVYDITDPMNPLLLGRTAVPAHFPTDLSVRGGQALIPTAGYSYLFGVVFQDQFGDLLTVDLTDPANPTFSGPLFGTRRNPDGSLDPDSGDHPVNGVTTVSDQVVYATTTTAAGGNPDLGVGQLLILDTSTPGIPVLAGTLDIPGTVQLVDVAVHGDRALVVGSTGGPGGDFANLGLTGTMTLTVLDITDPLHPAIIGSTLVTRNQFITKAAGVGKLDALDLGNGLFAVSSTTQDGRNVLSVIDPSDPESIVVSTIPLPSHANGLAVSGDTLYVTSQDGLSTYRIGPVLSNPITITVPVPKNTGVTVVSGSFNDPPSEIISGPDSDTYVWRRTLAAGTTDLSITWQSQLSGLQPDEARTVTGNGSVVFVANGVPASYFLPAQAVLGASTITLSPASRTIAAGASTTFTISLHNPFDSDVMYLPTVHGLPAEWVSLPGPVTVAAGETVDVSLIVTPDSLASAADYGFSVVDGLYTSAVQGNLTVTPVAVSPDSEARGIVVSLTPAAATAGQGTAAIYTVRLSNSGSSTETFSLSTSGLPGNVAAVFSQSSVTVPPGSSNFREVTLILTPATGATPGTVPFTVTAASTTSSAAGSVAGALIVSTSGVSLQLNKSNGAPGDTFTATVKNTGTTTDTFDLRVAGPAGLVSKLASSSVTLVPGQSQPVTVTTGAARFAVQGPLGLTVTAQSRSNAAVKGSASADLVIGPTIGLAARFDPTVKTLGQPGASDFLLTVNNTGNSEDAYSASIIGVTGSITASLIGLDGQPTQSIPVFRLPGLSTGAIRLHTVASATGTGTVIVQIRSLVNGSLVATSTATLNVTTPVLVGYHEFGAGADAGYPAVARFFNPDGSERYTKTVFPGLNGGVRVTSADFNKDGVADLVAGTGPGSITSVVVFDGVSGNVLFSIQPFEDRFTGGVFVAAGDLTGDGVPDLVITPDVSGGPRVRIFNGVGFAQIADFFGIDDPDFRGGARAGIGDVNGDGAGDLVVSAGFGGGPRIAVFDGSALGANRITRVLPDFFIFEDTLRNGAYIAVGDLDGDGHAEVIGGGGPGGGPRVLALSGLDLLNGPASQAGIVANYFAGDPNNRGGVRLVARDLDGDNLADLVVGDGTAAGSRVTGYLGKNFASNSTPPEQFAFDAFPGFTGGVYVG